MRKVFLSLLVVAFVVGVGQVAASSTPLVAFDLHFDGYCDGLHLNYPSLGIGTAPTVDGDQTGCVSGGVFGEKTSGGFYLTVPGFSTFTVIKLNHTWTHYALSGNLIFVLNSGTWSPGPPIRASGVSSSQGRAHAASLLRPTVTFELHFDGYCDGMVLNIPSAGLGTPGTVDGNRTGCSNPDGLMGGTGKVGSVKGAVVTFSCFDCGGLWIQTAILLDHTWIHYSVSGDLIYVLNSGTWSPGPPIGAAARSSSG
jgi:hypothetical protein